jgi:hypothetical protein
MMVDYDTISSWDAKLQKETYAAHFYLQLAIDDNRGEGNHFIFQSC